jgi:phage protein D
MATGADLPNGLKTFATSIEVKLMDKSKTPLKDIPHEDITNLEITEYLEEPGMFVVSLNDAVELNTQKPRWSTDTNIQPENMIKITIGYASDPEKSTLSFIGMIRSIDTQKGENMGTIEIRGYDLSHNMTKKDSKGFIYNKKKYSEIVTEIAGNNQLKTGKIETSPITYDNVTRNAGETDYAFLKKMTEEIGFEAFVQEESLYFRKPNDTLKGLVTPIQNWDIISFNPSINSAACVSEVTVTSWDYKKKEMISGKVTLEDIRSGVGIKEFKNATEKFKDFKITLNRISCSGEEAKNLAISELKRRNQNFIEADLKCVGNPKLRPGMTVNIEKVEKRFIGVYYIVKAIHNITEKGYITTMKLRGCI